MSLLTADEVSVGTYRRRRGTWRRWTGRRWSRALYAAYPQRLDSDRAWETYPTLPDAKRERLLEIAVDIEVLGRARVVNRSDRGVTLAYRKRVNHLGHAVLTVLTGGLWAVVWVVVCVTRSEDRRRLEIDAWGNVWPVEAP